MSDDEAPELDIAVMLEKLMGLSNKSTELVLNLLDPKAPIKDRLQSARDTCNIMNQLKKDAHKISLDIKAFAKANSKTPLTQILASQKNYNKNKDKLKRQRAERRAQVLREREQLLSEQEQVLDVINQIIN